MKKDIQATKRLAAVLERYGVTLRDSPQVVEHKVYGLKTEVSPVVLAVYEVVIKCAHLCEVKTNWEAVEREHERRGFGFVKPEVGDHYHRIAEKDGFTLMDKNHPVSLKQVAEDQAYCTRLIGDAGYYYELLD